MGASNGNGTTSRALAPAQGQQTALAQLNPQAQAFIDTLKNSDATLGKRVLEIVLSQPANKPLSAPRALAAAMYERENPGRKLGRDFYVDEKMGIVASYQGEKKDAEDRTEFYTQYRSLTREENEEHEVKPGDTAIACEGYQFALMRRLQAASIRYQPIIGIGIVRKFEKFADTSVWDEGRRRMVKVPEERWGPPLDPPTGKSWRWKAEQRSYKDCLRHMPGIRAATVADILEDAEDEGIDMDLPEGAHLSREQAEQRMIEKRHEAQRNALPEAERMAQAAANHAAYRERRRTAAAAFDDPPIEAEAREVRAPADALYDFPNDDLPDRDGDLTDDEYFDATPSATDEHRPAKSATMERAEEIRDRIRNLVGHAPIKPSSPTAGKMTILNMLPDGAHKATLRFLFGYDDLDAIAPADGAALVAWRAAMKDQATGEWIPSEQAINDAKTLAAAVTEMDGQASLFGDNEA